MSKNFQSPGLLGRLTAAAKLAVTGNVPEWFGPHKPLSPEAPPEIAGRQMDFPSGYNLVTQPRAYEPITFNQLRTLADNYDLMRLVIETRKDQIVKLGWVIQSRDKSKRKKADARIDQLSALLAFPDREHDWPTWVRELVEDMLVIDAATIYPRRTLGGQVYALELIDGGTIKRVLDDFGRTPIPPSPAYQQILKGLPAVDFTADKLLYLPRNVRTHRVYGFSPVEQVVMTVNIALRRQLHQLQYYTEGNVPEALIAVPETWTPDQVAQFQAYWDSLMEGNTAQRRHARFVPATIAKGYVQTKDAALKDEYDEWLARIICYAFSVSNQWAIKQMNRATADTAQEQALQEGLAPVMTWIKGVVDRILTQVFGYADLEFAWREEEDQDPNVQAQINDRKTRAGAMTLDEWRIADGLTPYPDGLGAEPLIFTASGAVKLRDVLNPPPPQQPQIGHNGGPALDDDQEEPPAGDQPKEEKLNKSARINRDRPVIRVAQRSLSRMWEDFLGKQAKAAASALNERPLAKSEETLPPEGQTPVAQDAPSLTTVEVTGSAAEAAIDAAIDATAWQMIVDQAVEILREVAVDGIEEGTNLIGLSAADVTALANPRAVAWAEAHAAELVGDLTDTTRQAMRNLIAKATREGWGIDRLSQEIMASYAFSPDRARLIAINETACSDMQGNLVGWKAAAEINNLTILKKWVEGLEENHCAACDQNVRDGAIPLEEAFSSGHQCPTAHPHCDCDLVAVIADDIKKMEGPRASHPFQKAFNPDQPRDANGKWTSGSAYDAASEILRGQAAMHAVVADHRDVARAMTAPGLGPVSFIWGTPGDAAKAYKTGYGISHIIAKRNSEGHDGQAIAMKIPEVIAKGEQQNLRGPAGGRRLDVVYQGHVVVLSLNRHGQDETWVLSGWKKD